MSVIPNRQIFISILILISSVHCQLRFISLGNFGSGSNQMSSLIKLKSKTNRTSFIISPGSNFNGGVKDLEDSKWQTSFEYPYDGLYLPFYTVAGIEDWKSNYTALPLRTNNTYYIGKEDENKQTFPKFTLPNWWYHYITHFADSTNINGAHSSVDVGAGFVFVDTYILSNQFRWKNITKLHWDNLRDTLIAGTQIFDWVFVVGDKAIAPGLSNKDDRILSESLRQLLKRMQVDAYISGRETSLNLIEDGTLLHINCNAYSGYCLHNLTKKHFTTELIDGQSGNVIGTYRKPTNVRQRSLFDRFHLYKEFPQVEFIPIPIGSGIGSPTGVGPAAGPSRGPGSARTRPSDSDLFIQTVGSLGVVISIGLGGLTAAIKYHQYNK